MARFGSLLTKSCGARVVVMALGVLVLTLAGPSCGGEGDGEPEPYDWRIALIEDPGKYCDVQDPTCREFVREVIEELRPQPTPLSLDERIREILMEDPAIQAMVGEGREGEDYWLRLTPKTAPWMGGDGAMADLVFANPVYYEGEVWSSSNPCAGQSDEGYVDPAQGCYSEFPEYSKVPSLITDARVISARVDITPGVVVSITSEDWAFDEDGIERQIEAIIEDSSTSP